MNWFLLVAVFVLYVLIWDLINKVDVLITGKSKCHSDLQKRDDEVTERFIEYSKKKFEKTNYYYDRIIENRVGAVLFQPDPRNNLHRSLRLHDNRLAYILYTLLFACIKA